MLAQLTLSFSSACASDYLHSWHFQSDGWLSPASAAVYDASTESLFIGRQDAMQRAGLALLARHFTADVAAESSSDSSALRVLDVGAGTGRFLTFVRDRFPGAHATALDLSPFYLAEAREAHAHWEELRGGARLQGGSASFVQAAAEALPFDDCSFDAVTAVYLFHELPPAARVAAAVELARVLRPGGVCVLTDSVQLGDRPAMDARLGAFGDFNEARFCVFAMLRSVGVHACDLGLPALCAAAFCVLRYRLPILTCHAGDAPPRRSRRSPTTAHTLRRTWGRSCAPRGWSRPGRRWRPRAKACRSRSRRAPRREA
jgi:ubiquinone/menaquinone biosynthesis C-methylase UbiE